MMDTHVRQSELLQVQLPKSNLVIKDYERFRKYRVSHYKNNYSWTGCKALGYTYETSRLFSLNVEILKLAGYNLLDYKTRHGKTISQAYEMLFKQYEDITISNHIAKKSIGSSSCGNTPYKTHNEFLVQEFGSVDDEWVPGTDRFINWSIRYVSEKNRNG